MQRSHLNNCGSNNRRPIIMSATKLGQKTITRRAEECRVSDLIRYTNESNRLILAAKNESKVSNLHRSNAIARVASEKMTQENDGKKELKKAREVFLKEQEDGFAIAISQRKSDEVKAEKEIQRILETSEELKELEQRLKTAYVNKERAAQHQESLLLRRLDAAREQQLEEKMEHDRQMLIRQEIEKDQRRRKDQVKQKLDLQEQILIRQKLSEKAKEDNLRDKEIVDAIMAKINAEDRGDMEERNRKKEETRRIVKEHQDERERMKAMLAKQEEIQEQQIKEYHDAIMNRNEIEKSKKNAVEEARKEQWTKVAEETKNQNRFKEEYNDLRNMLWEEELEERKSREDRERIARRAKEKEEMMSENQAQIREKRELIAKMEEEDLQLVKTMLDKFAADEEDEKTRLKERHLSKMRFATEAQQQREERARIFATEKERELEDIQRGNEQEEYRRQVVMEARKKLLERHSKALKGFLPKDTLRNVEEASIIER